MNEFDDLIPKSSGLFDDLIPRSGDSQEPATATTGEGLQNALKRGWIALQNIPDTLALTSSAGLKDNAQARYNADRQTRERLADALLEVGQSPDAQAAAYFKAGPEALIEERQRALAKPLIKRMAESEALPRSEAQQRLASAEGAGTKFKAWATDPVELTASIILESLPPSLMGAAIGSLGGPPGMVAGVGLSSGLSTFSSELLNYAQQRGIDIRDADAITKWLNSKEYQDDFNAAATKSAVVGVIDAATAGKAGTFISGALKQGIKKAAVGSAKEVALQAAGGASGEALGSLAAGKPIDPFDVFVEAIAEVGSAPGEVVGNLRRSRPGSIRGGSSLRNSIAVPTEPVPEGTAGSPVEGGRMFGAPEPKVRITESEARSYGPEAILAIATKYGVSRDDAVELKREGGIYWGTSKEVAPNPDQAAPIISPEPAAVTQTVGEEPARAAAVAQVGEPVKTTAQESRTTAETMTPEAIRAELDSVTKQIAEFQRPAADATTEAKLAYVDAKGKLSNRANFLREALKIQEEAAPTARERIVRPPEPRGAEIVELPSLAPVATPKSPSEILSAAKKVKVKTPEGATQIRVTDKSGKVAVQPLASVNKANPFIGVDVAKVEAGTIDKGGKFKPLAGDIAVTDVTKKDAKLSIEPEGKPLDESQWLKYGVTRDEQDATLVRLLGRALAGRFGNPDYARAAVQVSKPQDSPHLHVTQRSAILQLARIWGKRVIFYDDFSGLARKAEGGVIDAAPGVIFIRSDAPKAALAVFGHELTHEMRAQRPDLYEQLIEVIKAESQDFARFRAEKEEQGYVGDDAIWEELAANVLGDQLLEPAFLERLARRQPSLFQQVGRTIVEWLNRVIDIIKQHSFNSDAYLKDVERVRDTLADIVARYATEDSDVQSGGDRFSIENESEPAREGMTVNIAGRTYDVISKDRLTPEQRAEGDSAAQATFQSLGIPGVPDATVDKRAGSIDNNTVWKVVADGQIHDAEAEALRAHLVEQIQKQNTREGDAAYVSSLINAINMNFDLGNWRGVISQPVLESLLNVSVGESSRRGTMLRQLRGISEDIRAIAQNAALRLKWVYAEAFDPDGVGRDAMRKINELFRAHFTRQIINRVVSENPGMVGFYDSLTLKADAARPQLAEIIQHVFSSPVSKQSELADRFVAQLARGFTMSDAELAKAAEWFNNAFRQEMQFARSEALKAVLSSITKKPGSTRKPTTLAAKIEKIVNDGGLDDAELFRQFAKDNRWNIPTDKEIEQMREWVNREQQLRSPSPEEVARLGAEAARSAVEAATIDTRKELLRKMNTQWSQWTQPLVTNWRDLGNAEKVRNTNMAFNEWVAANLLLKIGFGTRQVVDVITQMGLNTPTRALAYAWENYRIKPDDSSLQHSIAEAFSDAYRTRLKVLGYALNSFKQTIKGKGEQRQVEQLISSIGIFDRALLNAQKMRAENKRGAANLLEVIAIGMRMGRQFAAAMDVVHGIPAEAQEIAHQVRNALKEKGLSGAALDVQFDSIMGILTAHRVEAISMAREILELRGADTSSGAVERAAWHILRDKIYNMAQQSGLATDDWKNQNALYRDLIGWNLTETGGLKAPGGPGGLIALGGKAAKEMLSKVPLVGGVLSVPFTFTNAMGISMNRKLAWSPLGFFPGIFKGSPHWEGEANIRQRKVEAAIGTGLNAMVFSLIIAGVWKALPAFWPKDEKERDRWVRNGWSPGMVIVPWGNDREVHLSTRTGPLAFFAPSIAAAAAYTNKAEDRAKKQLAINERAKKLGLVPEQLEGLGAADWMGIMFGAGYSALSGGRTASGAIGAYTDFGEFNVKKAAASVATAIAPGFPALNEFGRLAGANINPKLASFWDLMVPMPTSNAQRVNMLGDPMKDENDYRRVFTILSGGNFPFPTTATPAETQAYAALFGSEYRPPAINPSRGYQVGNKLRPMTADDLQRYTVARGQEFKQALSALGSNPTDEAVKAAFVSANQRALASVGVTIPKPSKTLARTSTRYRSRLRGGRTRRIRGFGRSRLRSRIGSRRRRLGTLK